MKELRTKTRQKLLDNIAILPSLITLCNGLCGFASINFAMRGMNDTTGLWLQNPQVSYFTAAAWFIGFGMICDGLDGFIARKVGSMSDFGGQLDSMSDVITFGVAPAFLMLTVIESSWRDAIGVVGPVFGGWSGKFLWTVAAIYVACAMLRLAKFNVESSTEEDSHMQFEGMPTPGAAGVVGSLVLLYSDFLPELQNGDISPGFISFLSKAIVFLLPVFTILVSLLMVSKVEYSHVVSRYVKGRRPFEHLAMLVIVLLLLFWKPQFTMAIVAQLYLFSGFIHYLHSRKFNTQDNTATAVSQE